jgi:hypothetical protein
MTSADGTHCGFRNVFDKITSHTVQKHQQQKSNIMIGNKSFERVKTD